MKTIIFLALIVLLLVSCQKSLTELQKREQYYNGITETIPPHFGVRIFAESSVPDVSGYYLALPALYDSTSKKYPLLVSVHTGEAIGNGTTDLYKVLSQGVPKLVSEGSFPASFNVGGLNYSFIIIAPQFNTFSQTPAIQKFIEYAEKHYRIDTKRIYLTGMSMGAVASWNFAVDNYTTVTAVVPMSGITTKDPSYAARVAYAGVPCWYFGNRQDNLFNIDSVMTLINEIRAFKPRAEFRTTIKDGPHDSWSLACDPAYHEEDGLNVYQWMLKWHK